MEAGLPVTVRHSVDVTPSTSTITFSKNTVNILTGVTAFVDCRSEGEERSSAVSRQLKLLGAVVSKYFNKKVTHVVFNDGRQSTYDRAKKFSIPMLSVLWVESSMETGCRAAENLFPARIDDCYENPLAKPKNYKSVRSWDVDMSFDLDDVRLLRNRRRREQRAYRRQLLDPTYVSTKSTLGSAMDMDWRPQVRPTLIHYETSSDEDERDDTVPPPLTHRLLQKYPDSPVLLEAYHRRERLKAAAVADVATSVDRDNFDGSFSTPPPPRPPSIPQTNTSQVVALTEDLSSVKTPKRLRIEAFSQSESEAEDKMQALQIDSSNDVIPPSRDSLEDFKVIRKPKRKVKRFLSPSTAERSSRRRTITENMAALDGVCQEFSSMIVLTSFELQERDVMLTIIKQLGRFQVESRVTDRTSHVICYNHRRTLSVLFGLARGCWLLSPEWVFKSLEAGKWIDEEPYELSEHFPTAQIYRLERANFPTFKCDIFAQVGSIYASQGLNISRKDLNELLILAGAKIAGRVSMAKIVIGKNDTSVSYLWVLDSIAKNELLPVESYRNKPGNV